MRNAIINIFVTYLTLDPEIVHDLLIFCTAQNNFDTFCDSQWLLPAGAYREFSEEEMVEMMEEARELAADEPLRYVDWKGAAA